MRKLFSIFSFVLLFSVIAFGQAQIDIPITVVSGPDVGVMAVGLDETATPGIDPALGEGILPPPPPAPSFDVRFDLAPYGGGAFQSLRDIREAAGGYPFSGTTVHSLKWQLNTGTNVEVQYDVPVNATMTITDNVTGTFFTSGPLNGAGSFEIPASFVVLGNARITMNYSGISPVVAGPIFGVAPASLNFGSVNVGSSANLNVTVSNTGNADLNITGLVSSNPAFTFAPSAPVTIAAGGNQVFAVTFTPTAAGLVNADLTFTHDAPGSPTVYSVLGTGYEPAPVFSVSPASLNFGSIAVGSTANQNVTVNNTGDAPLTLSGIVSSDPQYTFVPNTFPVNIAAGGNSVFVVTFTPTAAGLVNANLTFTHNAAGSPTAYAVQGTGFTTAPVFGLNPASLNFGNVSVGGSATLPVTVSNTGNAQLVISGITSSAAEFIFAPNTFPINVAAGGTQVFNVTFTPTAAGAVSGNLSFTHNAAGSPSALPLDGTGQTQGGTLRFVNPDQTLPDGSTNNPDAIVLDGYTGQPMKALQFDLIVGKTNGILRLNSIQRGAAVPAGQFNFSYEIYPGPTLPDGSSTDRVKVVIVGNGTNAIQPNPGVQEIMKFAFDIVDISGNSATTYNGLENVLGATQTPVIDANISAGADEIINIYNGTTIGLLGDVNLDDQVNILDILVMIDHILGRITLYTPLTGQAFTNGDLDNWAAGNLLPNPDGTINVLDLAVLQEIVRTGLYPSGNPVNKAVANPFNVVNNGLNKLTPGMNAKLTFFLTDKGVAVELESIKKVKGVQIELNNLRSLIPQSTQMTSIFDNALYYQNDDFLRMLSFDGAAEAIQPGLFVLSNLPFSLYDPQSIEIEKIIVADENNEAMQKVEVEIRYEGTPGLPVDYSLSQNFPNPFNPNTNVQFSVPVEGFVTIKVYDMLGQAVADLYSGNAQAGTYTLNWNGIDNNGNSVSSGSYIYRMTAGDFVQSKKMTFLK
jgi:hypothetical protein